MCKHRTLPSHRLPTDRPMITPSCIPIHMLVCNYVLEIGSFSYIQGFACLSGRWIGNWSALPSTNRLLTPFFWRARKLKTAEIICNAFIDILTRRLTMWIEASEPRAWHVRFPPRVDQNSPRSQAWLLILTVTRIYLTCDFVGTWSAKLPHPLLYYTFHIA